MTTRMLILAVALVCCSSALATPPMDFDAFKAMYGKVYATTTDEAKARAAFANNLEVIKKHQAVQPLAHMGITQFADMTQEEFSAFVHRGKSATAKKDVRPATPITTVPSKVDWVSAGAIGPVLNQGQCGDDYVFAALGNIEGVCVVTKKLKSFVQLSLQEIITCMKAGCNGGESDDVYKFLIDKEHGFLATAASWPPSDNTTCSFDNKVIGCRLTSYENLHPSEEELTIATATYGPINVAVDALSWQFYTGGILTSCSSSQIDHAVITAGYDDTYSTPYWTLQNSWGESWGENGFIRVGKGKNLCGIANAPVTGFVQS